MNRSIDRFIVSSLDMILAPFNAINDTPTALLFCKISQEPGPSSLCINSFLSSYLSIKHRVNFKFSGIRIINLKRSGKVGCPLLLSVAVHGRFVYLNCLN